MSVPTAESAPSPPRSVVAPRAGRPLPAFLTGGRLYGWLALLALALGALSLLFPSTPSYDPWAWLVWGREIIHGSLHTPGGPTWKPLPMVFTTIFAVFGSAQPNLWLLVARAGAALAVFMSGALAARLTWRLATGFAGPTSPEAGVRWEAAVPAALAALIAMASLALTGEFLDASTLGYSEGLMVAATLMALDRHLDGHYRHAFILGFVAALDRPEIWLFWGPYGLWLMWRNPGARALVIGLAVLTLFMWFVPQKWGGGSFTSGVARAHNPRHNSPAFASFPLWAELKDHAWPLVLLRIKVAAALTVLCALGVLWRIRATLPSWRLMFARRRGTEPRPNGEAPLEPRSSAALTLVVAGVFGLAWWVLVALETQAGFSGNDRYLVLGSAFIVLVGAVGYGWLAVALVRLLGRAVSRGLARGAVWAAAAVSALLFVFGPNFVGSNVIDIPRTHGSLLYQAHLRQDLVALMARHGGARGILACRPVMSEGFQVPMVAWYLNVRTLAVKDQPTTNQQGLAPVKNGDWPGTIFQDRDNRGAALLPTPQTIKGWEHQGAHYSFTVGPHHTMYFFQDCHAGSAS
ncbi:MAG TPA: hypothetical protein VG405_07200 [Solirubrobacteraceae bacterium]|nr:hypothetical protein [Solirubrobacteraceae bacterium]